MSHNILPFGNIQNTSPITIKFYLEKLSLKNFRNHIDLELNINNSPILIYGDNGSGKTNILEAISLLNQGKSLRKSSLEDYLCKNIERHSNNRWGINADIITPNGKFNIGTGPKENSYNKSRIARINSENVPLNSLEKILKILWITPQMCIVFQSGMSARRRLIDSLTSSLDHLHLNRVYKYEKLLRQRSKILIHYNSDQKWLDSIEAQLSELSVAITASRIDLINELNDLYDNELKNNLLTNNFPPTEIKLVGEIENLISMKPALEVENYIKLMLKKSRNSAENIFSGPNNTKIEILNRIDNKNVDICSTGEQKLILISLILAHARMLSIRFNMAPILLLDDIIEHLDKKHRNSLFLEISRHYGQTWFTSTSKEDFGEYPGLLRKINLTKIMNSTNGKYDFRYGEI